MTTATKNQPCACATPKTEDRTRVTAMPVDIYETKESFVISADMPGVPKDKVQVRLEEQTLSIEGIADVRERSKYFGRPYGKVKFARAFRIGEQVDGDAIQASMNQGVLTLRLPKTPKAQAKEITIQ